MTDVAVEGVAAAPAIMPSAGGLESRPAFGIMLVIGATLLFACHDTASKYLLAEYDVPLVSGIRYIVHTLLKLAIIGPRHGQQLIKTQRTGLVIVRGLCLVVATCFAGLALQRMPIAETTSIIYLAPILVVLLAKPVLGEKIGLLGWLAALGGFVGVVLIVRPGAGLDPLGVIFALSNVSLSVAYYLLSRILARSERTLALLFYSAVIGAIGFGIFMPWFWFDAPPNAVQIALFLSLGVTAGLGHYLFTAANRYTEASLLAPMTYVHLIWAGLLGWLVFGQLPDAIGLLGMAVIALAGVTVALRARFSRA